MQRERKLTRRRQEKIRSEVFEFCMSDSPLRHELTHERFQVVDGYVEVPQGPGLGVEVDEATVRQYLVT